MMMKMSQKELCSELEKMVKVDIYKPEDYVEMTKEDAELMKRFIDENKELFKKYCEKHKAHEKTE